jgi:uncharacterized membrane protein YeaQ/YmgE (transglycosylase-associated protein family)
LQAHSLVMTLFDIIGMLVIGLLVGLVARFLLPGSDPMGCLATALLGIAGSFVGGYLYNVLFHPATYNRYVRPGFLVSVIGAIIVLAIVRMVRRA